MGHKDGVVSARKKGCQVQLVGAELSLCICVSCQVHCSREGLALNMHQKEQKFGVGQQEMWGFVLQHLPAAFCKLLEQHPVYSSKGNSPRFSLLVHPRVLEVRSFPLKMHRLYPCELWWHPGSGETFQVPGE